MNYKILFTEKAKKQLKKLDKHTVLNPKNWTFFD